PNGFGVVLDRLVEVLLGGPSVAAAALIRWHLANRGEWPRCSPGSPYHSPVWPSRHGRADSRHRRISDRDGWPHRGLRLPERLPDRSKKEHCSDRGGWPRRSL